MKKKPDYNNLMKVGDTLFREQGYHNTGTEEILNKADYPRSSFYYHFKSKEGFGAKALEYYGQNVLELLEGILNDPKEKSPTAKLKAYFLMVANYTTEREYSTCCMVQRFSVEAGEKPGLLQETAHEQLMSWVKVAQPFAKEAQECGELRADLSSREIAEFLFNNIFGALTIGRLSRDPEEMKSKIELAFKLLKP